MESNKSVQYKVKYDTEDGQTRDVISTFLIVDSKSIIILGMPFLRDTKSIVDTGNNSIIINGESVVLKTYQKSLTKC